MWRFTAALALLLPAVAGGPPVLLATGRAQLAMLPLLPGEGCSSCPPAEQWLAGLREKPGLWRDFVPVAWHVTYWDRLGWLDRWARPAFTHRQYAYASHWRENSVYTPCFVRNGVEWQPGRAGGAGAAVGVLQVRYDLRTGGLQVNFAPGGRGIGGPLEVQAVQLGGGMVSRVRAGENSGRTLEHEFVALAAVRGRLDQRGGVWRAALRFPWRTEAGVPRRALAVWVTRSGGMAPLQATGGWIEH